MDDGAGRREGGVRREVTSRREAEGAGNAACVEPFSTMRGFGENGKLGILSSLADTTVKPVDRQMAGERRP